MDREVPVVDSRLKAFGVFCPVKIAGYEFRPELARLAEFIGMG